MTKVVASFYRASPRPEEAPDFHDLLREIAAVGGWSDRERTLANGLVLRLEHFDNDGDFIEGQFCRKQVEDIPPSAGPLGLNVIALGEGHGLGYLAAFRYHLPTRTLLLERNKMSASPIRIGLYLKKWNPACDFTFGEILRQDAWERFQNGEIRKFRIGLATPTNLEALEADGISAARSARMLAEAYEGITINLDVGVGRDRTKHLNKKSVRNTIAAMLGRQGTSSITVIVADEDGTSSIDFTGDALKAEGRIDYAGNDLGGKYNVRKAFLRKAFNDNLTYLVEHYGA